MPSKRTGSGITFAESCARQNPQGQLDPPKGRERRTSLFPRSLLPCKKTVSHNFSTPEPEELIDDEALYSRLQKMFIAAEEDGRGGLAIDEFKEAMRKTVGRHSTKEEIEFLFMKVDANCDGVVDWEEYVTYTLLEYKERTLMIEMLREKPFPNEMREIDSRHRDTIVRILFYPNIRKSSAKQFKSDYKSGKYVTLSKEGTIGLWSLSMRTVKYHNANHYTDKSTQPWFTDMVAMYNVNMLAISSTDRDIKIFDMSGIKFTLKYYITGFENCITCMDYWVSPKDLNVALLLIGDTSGSVSSMKFQTALRGGPFGAVSGNKNACKRVSFPEVVRGFLLGVHAQKFPNIHEDWVNKVQYLPEIDCFLSSCQAPQTALFFGDFAGKKTRAYFKVNKGVLSFDYSHILNIIVTGGMDYMLRVWNPYVNNKAIVLLKGHTKPVNHVIINGDKNQVISIDKGRSLRVYDLRDQTCLQQISGRMIKSDPFPVSAVFFNASMRTTLLATNLLVLFEKREEEERFSDIRSHNKAVVGALYNKVFNSVVSACRESVVSIWDVNTGDKLMQFVNAHSRQERGVAIPVEITALCFDNNGRRLVTGARNGTVHVWNFNNGSCMQKFELPDASDVTGIVCSSTRIYVSGWGKTVHVFVDGGSAEHHKQWKAAHKEDILCIAFLPPNIIATGAYDGDVVIWSRETGQLYCRLNAFESLKPIAEISNYNTCTDATKPIKPSSTGTPSPLSAEDIEEEGEESKLDVVKTGHWTKRNKKMIGFMGLLSKRGNSASSSGSEDSPSEEKREHALLQALNPDSFDDKSEKTMYSRKAYDNVCKFYESAVEKMLFLESRDPLQKETASVVTSGAEGWIRFWSMHHEGGLLGQFNAAHSVGESVLALKTDTFNYLLFTGDTDGYVKVWDIRDYCTEDKMSAAEKKAHTQYLCRKFTFFRVETYNTGNTCTRPLSSHMRAIFADRPPPACSEPDKTLKYPLLVNSFRAHIRSIHSVDYATDREIVITASADCSIRMWTINGQYIGTFGGELWSPLPKVVNNDYFLSQIPSDIRRSGSARTLKVMHGGKTPLWQNAMTVIRQRGLERIKKQFEHLQPKEVAGAQQEEDAETTNILGKHYKRQMNHKMRPRLPKFIETPGSVAVYHTLPFVELSKVDAMNSTIRDLASRRVETMAPNRLRGCQKKKPDVPAALNIYNKVVNKNQPQRPQNRVFGRIKKVADRYQGPLGSSSARTQNPVGQQAAATDRRTSSGMEGGAGKIEVSRAEMTSVGARSG